MASIFGHAIAGAIASQTVKTGLDSKKGKLLLIVAILLALLPDFDVLIYMMFEPIGMSPHRGVSHGLPFISLVAWLLALLSAKYFRLAKGKLFLIYFSALFSHPLLDILMGAGPEVPLFSPFSEMTFLSPITFIPWAYYSTKLDSLLQILYYPPALLGYCLEMLILIPIFMLLRKKQPRAKTIALLLITGIALLTTIIYYN